MKLTRVRLLALGFSACFGATATCWLPATAATGLAALVEVAAAAMNAATNGRAATSTSAAGRLRARQSRQWCHGGSSAVEDPATTGAQPIEAGAVGGGLPARPAPGRGVPPTVGTASRSHGLHGAPPVGCRLPAQHPRSPACRYTQVRASAHRWATYYSRPFGKVRVSSGTKPVGQAQRHPRTAALWTPWTCSRTRSSPTPGVPVRRSRTFRGASPTAVPRPSCGWAPTPVRRRGSTAPRPCSPRSTPTPWASSGPRWSMRSARVCPYLLKVLAADAALSLQVHPTPEQARAGWEAEEAAGVPRNAPQRNYKDPYSKPELIVALTPFVGLCGFRPIADLSRCCVELDVPVLAPLDRAAGCRARRAGSARGVDDSARVAGRPAGRAGRRCGQSVWSGGRRQPVRRELPLGGAGRRRLPRRHRCRGDADAQPGRARAGRGRLPASTHVPRLPCRASASRSWPAPTTCCAAGSPPSTSTSPS